MTKRLHVCTGKLSELSYERHLNTLARSLKKKVNPMLAFLAWLQSIFQSPTLSNYFCWPTCTLHQGKAGSLYCLICRAVQSLFVPYTATGSHSFALFCAGDAPHSYTTYTSRLLLCIVPAQPEGTVAGFRAAPVFILEIDFRRTGAELS